MGKLIFILGGARSGKSRYAQERASALGIHVTYLATGQAFDVEMTERITRHRADRPAEWRTVEEPLRVARALAETSPEADVVLIDCLTLFLTNWLMQPSEEGVACESAALAELDAILAAASASPAVTLIVSNEVGLGLVPTSELGRAFRDLAGWANQCVAAAADEVIYMVAGIPMRVKG